MIEINPKDIEGWMRSCFDKKSYPTEQKVMNAIRVNSVRFNKSYRYYKCPECGNFHTSTKYADEHKAS